MAQRDVPLKWGAMCVGKASVKASSEAFHLESDASYAGSRTGRKTCEKVNRHASSSNTIIVWHGVQLFLCAVLCCYLVYAAADLLASLARDPGC